MSLLDGLKIKATGIGSMPHQDAKHICELILYKFPDLPFWPQLPGHSARENMLVQYSENLPCIIADLEKKDVYFDTGCDREQQLLKFYENFTENVFDYFKISPEYAAGFYEMLKVAGTHKGEFLKGQIVGPITFLSSVLGADGKAVLYDEILSDAIIKALGMKAVWQVKQIEQINKSAVIFFDEPYLASFGSAFCNLSRERVMSILNETVQIIKSHVDVPVGVHCCGNTDWTMILELDIDIINFDFFGFGKYFSLYPDQIKKFIDKGGLIAWGVVPTSEYNSSCTIDILIDKFKTTLLELEQKGVLRSSILKNSFFTPACGMGLIEEQIAEKIIELTAELSQISF